MGLFSSLFQSNSSVTNLDSNTFEEQMKEDKDAVLIDVRTNTEYSEGHIPNSLHINIMSPSFKKEVDKLDRNKSYYVYCRSGSRSYQAGKVMSQMGFEKVYNLQGGIMAWTGKVE